MVLTILPRKLTALKTTKPFFSLASCVLLTAMMATKAGANTPEAEALAYNAAYEFGTSFGRSPNEMFTMLVCSSLWKHWDTIVSGSTDTKFTGSLRPELTSSHARHRTIYWERMARREMDDEEDAAEFLDTQASAQSMADEVYEGYYSGKKNRQRRFGGLAR
tara:strand:- start:548 stop:1033 length:486 start_codon:yes stop_codon:yes gene_type:complete